MRRHSGFTLVEIIIIMLTLGILVTIGTVTWNTAQSWSQNKTRENELNQWANTFELYKNKYGFYPGMPEGVADGTNTYYYCLGDFPKTSNKCGEYTSGTSSKYRIATGVSDPNAVVATTIRTELAKVGTTPVNSAPPLDQNAIGPYVVFDKSTDGSGNITITAKYIGIFKTAGNCPDGMTQEASPPMASSLSGDKSCKITKTLVYHP